MKIFLDLGAYTGDTLTIALKAYPDFDKFYAFEPLPIHTALLKERHNDPRIILYEKAASNMDGTAEMYHHNKYRSTKSYSNGTSLRKDKGNVDPNDSFTVETVDFSKFVLDNFNEKDYIVLKMDVEGAEYDILDKMLSDGSISYIDELYIEWHSHKLTGLHPSRHSNIVRALRKLGIGVTGSRDDVGKLEGKVRETING